MLPLAFAVDLSASGLRVGGLFWTSFHQPGSPNSCAPERKKVGLPTERQPATVLHHVDVFFLYRQTVSMTTCGPIRTDLVSFSWWSSKRTKLTMLV